jgi:hypothetical protein
MNKIRVIAESKGKEGGREREEEVEDRRYV